MRFTQIILVSFIFIIISLSLQAQEKKQMYKNPGCMCCDKWVKHMNENGFDLGITPSKKMKELKIVLGIPEEVRGCHTTVIDEIIIEGHVSVDLVHMILKERPDGIVGISVPGMPVGSPGLEGSYKENYPIVVFDDNGRIQLYEMR